ncbi:MAG: nucleoside/nucleotide kinase family protein [Pseudonocardiaceae bacterium]
MLALVGAPGAGKSTLARLFVDGVNERLDAGTAAYVPLDGFHLSNVQLEGLGLRHRKGTPDTFDVRGYLALLRRLRTGTAYPVYIPDYDRGLHEPVAACLVVQPEVRLIVTEGNYLACDGVGWRDVREMVDELWYLDVPDDVRETCLAERQMMSGLSHNDAWAWVASNDRLNGEVVKESRDNCTRTVRHASRGLPQ